MKKVKLVIGQIYSRRVQYDAIIIRLALHAKIDLSSMITADETPGSFWQTLSQIPAINRRGKRREKTMNNVSLCL